MAGGGDPVGLAGEVTSRDPAIGLHAVVALRQLLEDLERLHVDNARRLGWSWQAVADALRVSRQAVHGKHAARHRAAGIGPPGAEPGPGRSGGDTDPAGP
jgi:hypothetical protein